MNKLFWNYRTIMCVLVQVGVLEHGTSFVRPLYIYLFHGGELGTQ